MGLSENLLVRMTHSDSERMPWVAPQRGKVRENIMEASVSLIFMLPLFVVGIMFTNYQQEAQKSNFFFI